MRIRLLLAVSALLCVGLPGGIAAPNVACAADQSAVLVVATGGTTYRYCVTFPGSSVSGLDLIRLAGEQHGLQYSLGYGGRAVCQLAGVGPDGDDCFADHPNFWGYWRGDGSGGWSWSSTGAGSTTVRSGDVEGWAWGSGQDGNSHPQPPATTYSSVCTVSSDGEPSAGSGGSGSGGSKSKPGKAAKPQPTAPPRGTTEGPAEADNSGDVTEGAVENDDGDRDKRTKRSKKNGDPETGAPEQPDATAANEDRDERDPVEPALAAEEGPPPAGLIGLALAVLFGVFGAALAARRRRRG